MIEKQLTFLRSDGTIKKDAPDSVKLDFPGNEIIYGFCLCSDCPGFIFSYYSPGKKPSDWHVKRGIYVDTSPIYHGRKCSVCDCYWDSSREQIFCERYKLPLSGYRSWRTLCKDCGGSFGISLNARRCHPDSVWTCNKCGKEITSLVLQQIAASLRKQKYVELFGPDFETMLATGEIDQYIGSWYGSNYGGTK